MPRQAKGKAKALPRRPQQARDRVPVRRWQRTVEAYAPAQAAGAPSPSPEDADGERELDDPPSAAQLLQQLEPAAQAAGRELPQALG